MSTTVRTTATKAKQRVPMDSARKTALVGGAFYVITFAASIPALLLLAPVLHHPDYIAGAGADTSVLWGCFLDLVTALAGIGSAVALFSVVKRQHEGFALGFVTSRIVEAVFIVIGVVSLLAVVTLRQAGTAGTDAASLVTVGQALVAVRDWTFLLGPTFMAGVNALLLGTVMYRSRLVPRIIPTLGLIGGPLLLTSTTATMFGINNLGSVWSTIAVAPIFVWELSLGVYLVVKGFQPSPITAGMAAVSTPPAYRDVAA
jgi:Domain of unknown function (DUF4386)